MKTTIDIPEDALSKLMTHTRSRTKRDAVLRAIEEFNRRWETESLIASFGTWDVDSNDEIEAADLADAADAD